jgi:hypothetical protein
VSKQAEKDTKPARRGIRRANKEEA